MTPRTTDRVLLSFVLLVAGALLPACQKEVPRLEPVQKMAYGVKPAVVRINAYATAQFRYSTAAIAKIESRLRAEGIQVAAMRAPAAAGTIETGAGGSGSGFVIHPTGYILTSGHVVAPTRDRAAMQRELRRNGAIAALLKHFPVETLRTLYRNDQLKGFIESLGNEGSLLNVEIVNEVELSNGEKSPFTVTEYSPDLSQRGSDLAVIHIDRSDLPTLKLADSDQVHLQDSIWVVGYPAVASSTDEVIGGWLSQETDLEATVNPGTITSLKRNVANTPVFQTDVAIYRGNSGGPAVNRDGEVVAIATWGHTSAEQIKFLVPINVAKKLLEKAKIAINIEGKFSGEYRRALDDAADGDWIAAKRNLLRASESFPNSPDLIRFLRDADQSIGSLPFWRVHPVMTGTAVSAALLFVILLLLSRTPVAPPMPLLVADAASKEIFIAPGSRLPGVTEPGTSRLPGSPSMLGKFTILNGERAGERLGLGGSGIRIGRESSICEIVLENPKVSRLHAEVVSIDGKVLLIDRNSSNGTYVNDRKIERTYLKDGDIIYFGGRNAVAVAFHA